MNTNVVLAFIGGAVLASGIVYVAVKPAPAPPVAPVSATVSKPPAPQPVAASVPEPAEPAAPPAATPAVPVPREKPSPVRPAVRRERPVQIAQAQPPADSPALPQPVNKQRPVNDARQEPQPDQPAQPEPAPAAAPPVLAAPAPVARVEPPAPPVPNTVVIQAGTVLTVRMGETLSSKRNQPGDTFLATLEQPLVVDGFVIAERGARVEGRVVESDPGGKVQTVAHLAVQLSKLNTSDGQNVRINTSAYVKQAGSSRGTDAAKIGAGAALGAAIGAIAGGGKGAGIGAGIGGAAGAGDVLLTRGKSADIPVESRVTFRITEPVELTERLN